MLGTQYPQLSLKSIAIDAALARRLPYRLAYYYLALPVAQDADGISLVMAYPESRVARHILESILGAPVTPIRGSADEISAALNNLWSDSERSQLEGILYWGPTGQTPSANWPIHPIATVAQAQITMLDASKTGIDTAMRIARDGGFSLLIVDTVEGVNLPRLVRSSSTSLFILRRDLPVTHRILVVLRGHSPDESILDWIVPLAQITGASVSLLVIALPILPFYTRELRQFQGLAMLLSPDSSVQDHIHVCGERLTNAGIEGYLKLRQGPPRQQIAEELADGNYDLVAIAAEGHGEFVEEIFTEVESRSLDSGRAFMILKPTLP